MNKLTAEKCSQLLDSLNSNGMSILEGYYCEALEIALPILEQQEMITDSQLVITDNAEMITNNSVQRKGEWIEWGGGKQPIAIGKKVDVRYRDGVELYGMQMGALFQPNGSHMDIIAYRIIPERSTNQNGEQ